MINFTENYMLNIVYLIVFVLVSLLFAGSSKKSKIDGKVSVVIPAYNEEKAIEHVINTVKQVKDITEIIIVDDGSTDNTHNIVSRQDNVILLTHEKNKGKGSAMKTGLKRVTNDIVLFLDADLSEINKLQVESIIKPILNGDADITKTKFKREAGRVTELTAKPLLNFFFPELSFEQPLSGQFAAIKSFLDNIDLEHDYGVDIGIVLDADAQGMRIQEVDIGNIVHEMSTLKELNIMANEVVRTIVDRAIHYGRLTMMDDVGSSIRMEIMGLTLIIFGIFGLFFINPMTPIIAGAIIVIGIVIAAVYLVRIIRTSLRVYRQSKIPNRQIIRTFIQMHFPVLISVVILLVIAASLLGSVNIASNQISIEPVSKNLVISTSPEPHSAVDVRGPYTIDNALENEEHLVRLSNSALSTLHAQYGDYIYIDGERYQLEQALDGENDLIRMPESARTALDVSPGDVIRDSDLRSSFENVYLVQNINPGEEQIDNNTGFNNTTSQINTNNTTVNIGSEYTSQTLPEKVLTVYLNNTPVAQTSAAVLNSSYNVYIDGVYDDSIMLNNSSTGIIYNSTYDGTTIRVELENQNGTTNSVFANQNSTVKFLNINLNFNESLANNTTNIEVNRTN